MVISKSFVLLPYNRVDEKVRDKIEPSLCYGRTTDELTAYMCMCCSVCP